MAQFCAANGAILNPSNDHGVYTMDDIPIFFRPEASNSLTRKFGMIEESI